MSKDGYRIGAKGYNDPFKIIPGMSGIGTNISMLENDGTPLRKGPLFLQDNFGNFDIGIPGMQNINFTGDYVTETPIKSRRAYTDLLKMLNQKNEERKRLNAYGFLHGPKAIEPNVVGGAGIKFGGFGVQGIGVIPTNNDPVFKGVGEFGINQDFGNLNLGVNVGVPFLNNPFTGERMPYRIEPKIKATYNFQDGGSLPRAQEGNGDNVKYVSDPEEYKYLKQAEDDSLTLYNMQRNFALKNQEWSLGSIYSYRYDRVKNDDIGTYDPKRGFNKNAGKEVIDNIVSRGPQPIYPSLSNPYKWKNEYKVAKLSQEKGIYPIGSYRTGEGQDFAFKKPTQKVKMSQPHPGPKAGQDFRPNTVWKQEGAPPGSEYWARKSGTSEPYAITASEFKRLQEHEGAYETKFQDGGTYYTPPDSAVAYSQGLANKAEFDAYQANILAKNPTAVSQPHVSARDGSTRPEWTEIRDKVTNFQYGAFHPHSYNPEDDHDQQFMYKGLAPEKFHHIEWASPIPDRKAQTSKLLPVWKEPVKKRNVVQYIEGNPGGAQHFWWDASGNKFPITKTLYETYKNYPERYGKTHYVIEPLPKAQEGTGLGYLGSAFDLASEYELGKYIPEFLKQPVRDLAFSRVRPGPYPTGEDAVRHIALSLARGAPPTYTNQETSFDFSNTGDVGETTLSPDNRTFRSDDLLYGKALGQEGANLPESKYRPAEGTKEYSSDPTAKYYSISQLVDLQQLLNAAYDPPHQASHYVNMPFKDSPYPYTQFRPSEQPEYFDPIANYTTRKGEDEKGKYISYYDKYDFNNPLLNSLTEPYEIYDRIYYTEDPKTGKYIPQKRKGGSLPKAQEGNGDNTYYTSDPNDPRLKAYDDSAYNYNEYIKLVAEAESAGLEREEDKIMENNPYWGDIDRAQKEYFDKFKTFLSSDHSDRFRNSVEATDYSVYASPLSFMEAMGNVFNTMTGGLADTRTPYHRWYIPEYDKPTQPVGLDVVPHGNIPEAQDDIKYKNRYGYNENKDKKQPTDTKIISKMLNPQKEEGKRKRKYSTQKIGESDGEWVRTGEYDWVSEDGKTKRRGYRLEEGKEYYKYIDPAVKSAPAEDYSQWTTSGMPVEGFDQRPTLGPPRMGYDQRPAPIQPRQGYDQRPNNDVAQFAHGGSLPKAQSGGFPFSYEWDTGSTTAGDQAEPLRQKNIYEEARTEGTQVEKARSFQHEMDRLRLQEYTAAWKEGKISDEEYYRVKGVGSGTATPLYGLDDPIFNIALLGAPSSLGVTASTALGRGLVKTADFINPLAGFRGVRPVSNSAIQKQNLDDFFTDQAKKWKREDVSSDIINKRLDNLFSKENSAISEDKLKALGVDDIDHFKKWLKDDVLYFKGEVNRAGSFDGPTASRVRKKILGARADEKEWEAALEFSKGSRPPGYSDEMVLDHEIGHLIQVYLEKYRKFPEIEDWVEKLITKETGRPISANVRKHLPGEGSNTRLDKDAMDFFRTHMKNEGKMSNIEHSSLDYAIGGSDAVKFQREAADWYKRSREHGSPFVDLNELTKIEVAANKSIKLHNKEPFAHLRETRSALLESGVIKYFQEPITIAKLREYKKLPHGKNDRLLSFLKSDNSTMKGLKDLLNRTPVVGGVVGTGTVLSQKDQYKYGGELPKAQSGGETGSGILGGTGLSYFDEVTESPQRKGIVEEKDGALISKIPPVTIEAISPETQEFIDNAPTWFQYSQQFLEENKDYINELRNKSWTLREDWELFKYDADGPTRTVDWDEFNHLADMYDTQDYKEYNMSYADRNAITEAYRRRKEIRDPFNLAHNIHVAKKLIADNPRKRPGYGRVGVSGDLHLKIKKIAKKEKEWYNTFPDEQKPFLNAVGIDENYLQNKWTEEGWSKGDMSKLGNPFTRDAEVGKMILGYLGDALWTPADMVGAYNDPNMSWYEGLYTNTGLFSYDPKKNAAYQLGWQVATDPLMWLSFGSAGYLRTAARVMKAPFKGITPELARLSENVLGYRKAIKAGPPQYTTPKPLPDVQHRVMKEIKWLGKKYKENESALVRATAGESLPKKEAKDALDFLKAVDKRVKHLSDSHFMDLLGFEKAQIPEKIDLLLGIATKKKIKTIDDFLTNEGRTRLREILDHPRLREAGVSMNQVVGRTLEGQAAKLDILRNQLEDAVRSGTVTAEEGSGLTTRLDDLNDLFMPGNESRYLTQAANTEIVAQGESEAIVAQGERDGSIPFHTPAVHFPPRVVGRIDIPPEPRHAIDDVNDSWNARIPGRTIELPPEEVARDLTLNPYTNDELQQIVEKMRGMAPGERDITLRQFPQLTEQAAEVDEIITRTLEDLDIGPIGVNSWHYIERREALERVGVTQEQMDTHGDSPQSIDYLMARIGGNSQVNQRRDINLNQEQLVEESGSPGGSDVDADIAGRPVTVRTEGESTQTLSGNEYTEGNLTNFLVSSPSLGPYRDAMVNYLADINTFRNEERVFTPRQQELIDLNNITEDEIHSRAVAINQEIAENNARRQARAAATGEQSPHEHVSRAASLMQRGRAMRSSRPFPPGRGVGNSEEVDRFVAWVEAHDIRGDDLRLAMTENRVSEDYLRGAYERMGDLETFNNLFHLSPPSSTTHLTQPEMEEVYDNARRRQGNARERMVSSLNDLQLPDSRTYIRPDGRINSRAGGFSRNKSHSLRIGNQPWTGLATRGVKGINEAIEQSVKQQHSGFSTGFASESERAQEDLVGSMFSGQKGQPERQMTEVFKRIERSPSGSSFRGSSSLSRNSWENTGRIFENLNKRGIVDVGWEGWTGLSGAGFGEQVLSSEMKLGEANRIITNLNKNLEIGKRIPFAYIEVGTNSMKVPSIIAIKKQFGGEVEGDYEEWETYDADSFEGINEKDYLENLDMDKALSIYRQYIEGVFEGTKAEVVAEKIYDKLNRVFYEEAEKAGMSVSNYIMSNIKR